MQKEIVDLQMRLMEQTRQLDDLNQEVLRLSKLVSRLEKQYIALQEAMQENLVKPLSEETPPPHY